MKQRVVAMLSATLCVLVGATSGSGAKDPPAVSIGEYQVLLGGRLMGRETFRVTEKKGYVIESTSTLYWPEPIRHHYVYELDSSYRPKKARVTVTRGGAITELKLEPKGRTWRMEIQGKGRKKTRQELGRRDGVEIDMGSPIFSGLILRRLDLNPGEEKTVEVIHLQLPDLAGRRSRRVYRRLEDEELEIESRGKVHAAVYAFESGETTHKIWLDSRGRPVHHEVDTLPGRIEHNLVRIDSKSDAW